MIIGYARTSTVEQVAGFEAQIMRLETNGCTKVYSEQVSSIAERAKLEEALEFVREGDVFMVTKLDRLARNTQHLLEITKRLEGKGVALRVLDFGLDTATPTGKLMLTMLGAIGQFEREIMLERQREGIAKAKAEGAYKGRKPIDDAKKAVVMDCLSRGYTKEAAAQEAGVGVATIYRMLKNDRSESQ